MSRRLLTALLAKAGTCGACPKRTGNQVDLFGDVKVCTYPVCFVAKGQAHYAQTARGRRGLRAQGVADSRGLSCAPNRWRIIGAPMPPAARFDAPREPRRRPGEHR
jgi:hypothetical protein